MSGAYGHINHPFEDKQLKFSDMEEIIDGILHGKFCVFEKTDGQNLLISWKNNKLVAARNKGHLKNKGRTALDIDGVKEFFQNKPTNIQNAFNLAMEDLSNVFLKLDKAQLNGIFRNGQRFMSLEIIYSDTQNVIPYESNILVFHSISDYDDDGIPTLRAALNNTIHLLMRSIRNINESVSKTFSMVKKNVLTLPILNDNVEKKKHYFECLKRIQQQSGLTNQSTILDYYRAQWYIIIHQKAQQYGYKISTELIETLLDRWADSKKNSTITNVLKTIDHAWFKQWVYNVDQKNIGDMNKTLRKPLEILFLQLGADVLQNVTNTLVTDKDAATQKLLNVFKKEIERINLTGCSKNINLLDEELERLVSIGDIRNLAVVEGMTFCYGGNIYKLTGYFPVINNIIAILKYKK